MKLITLLFDLLFSLFESITGTLSDFVVSTVASRRKTGYDADFDPPSAQLQTNPTGFRIGTTWGNSSIEANSHLICLGGSGSKKSSSICFPQLLQCHNCSYIVHDCSGELFNGTATEMYNCGYEIFTLDPDNSEQSIGFNSLAKCNGNEAAIYRIANVLTTNSLNDASYDYWAQSAEEMIGFFSYALVKYAEPQFANLYNVSHAIQTFSHSPQMIDKWIVSSKDSRLISQYKSFVATPDRTLQSSLASAKNILTIYNNPVIGAITSTDTMDFELFRKRKCILYLRGTPSQEVYTRGLRASLFDSFFSYILNKLPEPGTLDITFLIDEASSMRLSSLPQLLAVGRKYRISVATLWQDYNQTEAIFGKNQAANILANSRLKVFMPSGQPISTCRMLSELVGKYEYTTDDGLVKIRELLTPQEIYQLKKILVLNGNGKPILVEPHPYFLDKNLLEKTRQPIYKIENKKQFNTPPLINF